MITGLDGLRAIAFLIVLGQHSGVIDFGWMGVQLFFVLSGFLITGILLRMKATLPVKQYFYKFYGRRFLRIFPLYFFYLIILTIAIHYNNLLPLKALRSELLNVVQPQLSYAYLYTYDFFHATAAFHGTPFLSHLWSLSVEEQFYIFWPLLLFFTPSKNLKKLFLFTIALGPILRLLIYFIYNNHLFSFLHHDTYLAIYILPFSHVDAFAMGAYISLFQLPKPRKQLAILACAVPLLGFALQYIADGEILPLTLGYGFRMPASYKFIWGYSILNYLFALIIHTVDKTKLFENMLEHVTLRYLGKISYGLYVYHTAVIWFIIQYLQRFNPNINPLLKDPFTYVAALIITIIISSVSFYLLEKPITDLKDRFFPLRSN